MTNHPVLSDDTRTLLGLLADKLDNYRPNAEMLEATRQAQALVFAEQLHGPTEAAFAAEQDLLAAAPPVRAHQTRSQYATVLRGIAQGASQ